MGRWSRGHRRASRNPNPVSDGSGSGAPNQFGSLCAYDSDGALKTTTSTTTFVSAISIARAVGAGDYLVSWFAYDNNDDPTSGNGKCEFETQINAAVVSAVDLQWNGQGVGAQDNRLYYGQTEVFTLPAGPATVELLFRVDPTAPAPGDQVSVTWCAVELWRFS